MKKKPKIFNDKEKYIEMIGLIDKGLGASEIAKIFNCDHTTIIYHMRRRGIRQYTPVSKPRLKIEKVSLMNQLFGERINIGKLSYKDYVREEEKRIGKKIKLPKNEKARRL